MDLVALVGPVQHLPVRLHGRCPGRVLVVGLVALVDDAVLGLAVGSLPTHHCLRVLAALQAHLVQVLGLIWFHA